MVPNLYDKTGNTIIGDLSNAIECLVTEERNGLFELTMVYPINYTPYSSLVEGNVIIADANDTLKAQKFRIYMTRKLMSNRIEVYARHISFDLAYDFIEGLTISNQSCEYALNQIFRSSQFSTGYTGVSDIVNTNSMTLSRVNCLEALGGTQGSILDTFGTGAEILRDNKTISVLNARGHNNNVSIEYKKNLTGFELEEDTTDLVTRIYPFATYKNGNTDVTVTVPQKFVDSPLINNYSHQYIKEYDYSDKFEDGATPTASALIALANKEFTVNKVDIPKQNYKIEFIPLSKCVGFEGLEDRISLCDTVTIIDTRYNVNTLAKVVKYTFDVLRSRYESMELGKPRTTLGDIIGGTGESNQGPVGPQGPAGPPGADGNIGDFPNSLPSTPVLTSQVYGFGSIDLSWTYESQVYYEYELYASKTNNFTPNTFDLIFKGQASTFLHQVVPGETWYYRVCCLNSHGYRTAFSSQVTVTTQKVTDLSNYVSNMAIGDALIGTLNLERGWVGQLKGNWIDAKQLSVTDGNNKRTLWIDSYGNVSLDVANLKINASNVATESYADSKISQSASGVLTTVSQNYPSKNEVSDTYSTKTEMNLTSQNLLLKFSGSGGYNLIKNSNFKNAITYWDKQGTPSTFSAGNYRDSGYGNVLALVTTNTGDYASQQITGLKAGRTYNISAYVYVMSGKFVLMQSETWGGVYTNGTGWQWISFNYTPSQNNAIILFGCDGNSVTGTCHVTAFQMAEGDTRVAWSPHPSEIYSGYTKIGAEGVDITNGALKITNANSQVVIDGQYNVHKIVATGLENLDVPYGVQERDFYIVHNLGYIPHFSAEQMLNNDGNSIPLPAFSFGGQGTSGSTTFLTFDMVIRAYADNNKIWFNIKRTSVRAGQNDNVKVRWNVYKEVAF